ncbi:MAG: carboxypeptidase regulatory-like domain-containing protein [Acidobacteriaceae bacterium]|nr:carboxypeptidase regulatory-like domain-containing protein [Acidobacteriaceae bacterium]MBV9497913.1 carboxypeptidase regulatory-like domain-containing protein [Acidobacteriaceae bacterium]
MGSIWRFSTVAALSLCAGICTAQVVNYSGPLTSANPAGHNRYTVSGSVVNAVTGEPVRRALVRLQGPEQHSAFTGADGRFEIPNVLEGSYMPNAQRPGFFEEQPRNGLIQPRMFVVSASIAPLVLKLSPESALQGHAGDDKGEPIEDLQIQLVQPQIISGRRSLQPAQMATTDENGDFLIEGLQPGEYLVRSLQRPVEELFNVFQHRGEVYPQRYYPDAVDLSSAQPLAIRPGETARADFKLSPVPAFRVSGVAGPAPNGAMISVEDETGQEVGMNSFGPGNGRWVTPLLPSGSWTISFRTNGAPNGGEYFGRVSVNVDNAEVRNLQVPLASVPSIPVQVLNGPETGQPNLQLRLISRSTNQNGQSEFYAGIDQKHPSGPLVIQGALPGNYRVVAQAGGPYCVASVSSGGTDFSNNDLVISPGSNPAPLQVSLRSDCAELNLQMRSADTNAHASLLLVSDSNVFEPRPMMVQAGASFGGGTLPPGNYRLYTVADLSNLEYMNPEALRNLSAQEITLAPNQKATVTIDVPGEGGSNAQ